MVLPIKAVSYTHLDVYKRQVFIFKMEYFLLPFFPQALHLWPVELSSRVTTLTTSTPQRN